ncbi:MAG TPA: superoxide dismutase [Polyangiaceae bacterium LLY-WYZ-15_(1-7)]|nr:superoxide dismutase [Fe] [Sandaracinus sp.]HJL01704.1 superoxide dismutase [Polyangiaceae bacterium LLY-WYZ-15_(1-7)]HJL08940.1 superoxide dismutase [Polyangiaceae bacterium LLY-WYZ-15_(1-7)]HJL22146.1 superoxide dismutase [Polyangiaceae bacterium LLY-WYZ-15_(1-7)]HJL33945.1 superoxide dismutase [Polyangiaceae bacterium LLY-WYZ-15_(1-7)]
MNFEVEPLPYSKDALAPAISEKTLNFHYDKHHQGYMKKLKAAIEGTPDAEKSLVDFIKSAEGGNFNNAAQVWNHTFFWKSMKPGGGGAPTGAIADAITRDFGSYEKFAEEFTTKSAKQFGSGWGWLVLNGGKLEVVTTSNAGTPLTTSAKPILTVDVWEHAYYLDYQNDRGGFLKVYLEKLVNWDFANANLG